MPWRPVCICKAHHDRAPIELNRACAIGIALNMAFVAIEAFYGRKIDSLALLAGALTRWMGWVWRDPVAAC